jgi:hypothetical protein
MGMHDDPATPDGCETLRRLADAIDTGELASRTTMRAGIAGALGAHGAHDAEERAADEPK